MIYIGHFVYLNNQEQIGESERRHGEFSLLIEAESGRQAVRLFRDRIVEYRQTKDFFTGNCLIYFMQLLEFDRFPRDEAAMLNFKSYAGDPLMPFIGCALPSKEADWCKIYDWEQNQPKIDGQNEHLFMEFKAEDEFPTTDRS